MISKKMRGYDFLFEFRLFPSAQKWSLHSHRERRGIVIEEYRSEDYTLKLELESDANSCVLWFDLSREHGEEFSVEENRVISTIPTVNLHSIWGPSAFPRKSGERQVLSLPWFYENEVATQRSMPVLFVTDRVGMVRLAFGFIDQRVETSIKSTFPGISDYRFSEVQIEIKRPIKGIKLRTNRYCDGIFVSSGMDWFNTMRKYTRIHDNKRKYIIPELPDYAYDPVWNTLAVGEVINDVNEKNVFANAQIAAHLGFKTVLIDEGWSEDKRYPVQAGDYIAQRTKFPEMRKFVQKLKKLGLRVMLWCAPFTVGEESRSRKELEKNLIQLEVENEKVLQDFLCPRNPFVQEHVPKLVARIIADYDLDGVKVDFVNSVPLAPCVADHEHNYDSVGLAMDVCLRKIREAIERVSPGALIEYRQSYANINNRPYGNLFRAVDCPLSYDYNRRLCTFLRPFSTDVAVHVDPVLWHPKEDIRNVAKTMMTIVLVGVPTVGINLLQAPKDQLKLVERWIAFYKAHREDLGKGDYLPVQNDPQFSIIKIERKKRAYILLCSSSTAEISLVADKIEDVYVFNCTNKDFLYIIFPGLMGRFKATIFDEQLNEKTKEYIESKGDKLIVDLRIPQGSYAKLQREDQ